MKHWKVSLLVGLVGLTIVGAFGGEKSRRRCGTVVKHPQMFKMGTDCDAGQTVVRSEYNPVELMEIPVVVHVLYHQDGTGLISEDKIHEQIRILNEDFRAIAGSNSEDGNDAMIQFYLATTDPSGNPTDGMTFTQNSRWFDDGDESVRAEYGSALAWDSDRYLNIFVNSGGGSLGYVVNMPWDGLADPDEEGVVVAYDGFGLQPGTPGADLGHTAAHEVGHYLGLEHTFGLDDFCASGDCYSSGDMICDTNPHLESEGGCEDEESCGEPEPIHNFMNYTSDSCIYEFTSEQINRMRCSIVNYRSNLVQNRTTGEPDNELEDRWITHITGVNGGFVTSVHLNNPGASRAELILQGYDNDGNSLDAATFSLNAGAHRVIDLASAFPSERPTHIGVSGSDGAYVSAAYKLNRSDAAEAHVHENRETGVRFLLYPGDAGLVFDGVVVVNSGSEDARVEAAVITTGGQAAERSVLAAALEPGARYLNTFDAVFGSLDGRVVEITASQPVTIMALRGSRPGAATAILYANPIIKVE